MVKTVDFIFDFGSPNAYLAHKVIPSIEARTGARFSYVHCLLGGIFKATNNRSPMVALADIPAKFAYEQKEMQRFIARRQIAFEFNPHFPVNTLAVMRGAVAAEMDGALEPYVDAVMDAMWRTPRKMDDPEIIRATLDAAGLDGARLLARTQEADVKQRLIANTERAVARGAFGAPTFFIGDEMWFGKDRLRDVEEALAS